MAGLILALDQGTTNTKALLLDQDLEVVARASCPVAVSYPRRGWVEQSAEEIWRTVETVIGEVLQGIDPKGIAGIGISNQRESVLVWERKSGRPIGPCITWQCRRSAERLERLRTSAFEAEVLRTTGLGLDPLFPAAKLGWLLDAYPQARALAEDGGLCAGTVDSWLIYRLTGGRVHATDCSNASRTQLFDIHERAWSQSLAAAFGVPIGILPSAVPSDSRFGHTAGGEGIPAGLPILAAMGDSHAALFGHGIRTPGMVKATYGTGSSLMTLTDGPVTSASGLSTTIAWQRGTATSYALEGNITVSAQAAAWVAALLGLADVSELTALAASVPDSGMTCFVPALVGLGAPHWRPDATALFTGMTLGTSRGHLARSTLEAIAFQVGDVFSAMEADLGRRLDALSVDGGATANRLLMQIQSDLIGRPVAAGRVAELSAFGAGLMAGLGAGLWSEASAAAAGSRDEVRFEPALSEADRQAALARWRDAMARTLLPPAS